MKLLINGYLVGGNCPPFVAKAKELGINVKIVDVFCFGRKDTGHSKFIEDQDIIGPRYTWLDLLLIKIIRKFRVSYGEKIIIYKQKKIIARFGPHLIWNHRASVRANIMLKTGFTPQVTTIYGTEIKDDNLFNKDLIEVFEKSKYILTTTSEMRQYLAAKYPHYSDKIRVFSWGLNIHLLEKIKKINPMKLRKKYSFSKEDFIVIDYRALRGLDTGVMNMVEAVKKAKEVIPFIKLILVKGFSGSCEIIRKVREKAEKQGLRDNIKIINKALGYPELFELLHLSDVFISILKHDQFGLSVLEGMFFEKYLILSDLDVYMNNLGQNAFYIQGQDSNQIVAALHKIFHGSHHTDLKANLKVVTSRYDFDKNAEKIFMFLKSVCNG